MNEPLIRLTDIHKSYGANHVLRGISLEVEKSEVLICHLQGRISGIGRKQSRVGHANMQAGFVAIEKRFAGRSTKQNGAV